MQRKFLLSLTIVLTCLSLTISLIACSDTQSKEKLEQEKTALTSLKKLQSKIELGIDIKDYLRITNYLTDQELEGVTV